MQDTRPNGYILSPDRPLRLPERIHNENLAERLRGKYVYIIGSIFLGLTFVVGGVNDRVSRRRTEPQPLICPPEHIIPIGQPLCYEVNSLPQYESDQERGYTGWKSPVR